MIRLRAIRAASPAISGTSSGGKMRLQNLRNGPGRHGNISPTLTGRIAALKCIALRLPLRFRAGMGGDNGFVRGKCPGADAMFHGP